tara:strand:+ start:960 stop:1154 length:195 start_codon:yes stop_codon:yes gene_type:complete
MYYTGTQAMCIAYNIQVGEGEKYSDTTTQWGEVIVEGESFAIIKHSNYKADLKTLSELSTLTIL